MRDIDDDQFHKTVAFYLGRIILWVCPFSKKNPVYNAIFRTIERSLWTFLLVKKPWVLLKKYLQVHPYQYELFWNIAFEKHDKITTNYTKLVAFYKYQIPTFTFRAFAVSSKPQADMFKQVKLRRKRDCFLNSGHIATRHVSTQPLNINGFFSQSNNGIAYS